jgi:hypothetical protein
MTDYVTLEDGDSHGDPHGDSHGDPHGDNTKFVIHIVLFVIALCGTWITAKSIHNLAYEIKRQNDLLEAYAIFPTNISTEYLILGSR